MMSVPTLLTIFLDSSSSVAIAIMYITSLVLIYLIIPGSLYLLAINSPSPPLLPLVTTNLFPYLFSYEFDLKKFLIRVYI